MGELGNLESFIEGLPVESTVSGDWDSSLGDVGVKPFSFFPYGKWGPEYRIGCNCVIINADGIVEAALNYKTVEHIVKYFPIWRRLIYYGLVKWRSKW